MSRRGGRVEEYEERSYYGSDGGLAPGRSRAAAPVRARDLLEIDINSRRERSRDRQPEFLREDYVRTDEQPLVLRKREVETFRPARRSPPRARSPSIERERLRARFVERQVERSPSPAEVERVRTSTRVVERERERSPESVYRTRVVERERDRDYSPDGERTRTRFVERERERDRSRPRESSIERVRTTTRTVERERERERSPSPIRERIRTRVVERERERSLSSESSRSAIIEPEPPIIRAPPIHQEVITHHRHIDHGYEYRPVIAPTPPPPIVRPRPKETSETEIDIYKGKHETEIDIHTSTKRNGRDEVRDRRPAREYYDDDVLIERDRERLHVRESHDHRRSSSARRDTIGSYESEADYYARKTAERGRIGEAYNGATRDWEIVDVPPGTERVRMDGVGGGSQEITWQRYNGVRRSKFVPERDSLAIYDREREYEREEVTDRRIAISLPPRNKYGDMWTEITKDLVVREAIEELGYDYEETEYFYYIIQYLKYEDVQELVYLSEDIRRARKNRIRDMAHERERLKGREVLTIEDRRRPEYDDERIIEREIVYESPRRPRGYR